MTTKAPATISPASEDSLEKLAYGVVADIETREPNDRNRLGYCVWSWLKDRKGTLEQAVVNAGCRSKLTPKELTEIIRKRLVEKGVDVS
jgi:hypothetical protein